ncbi:MAG: hypothetical protein LAP21_19415 [Acidobacteriia bacterium]|nr:hypothetical protein [Terriglobia bacterium]
MTPGTITGAWLMSYSAPDGTTRQMKLCYGAQPGLTTAFNQPGILESPNNIMLPPGSLLGLDPVNALPPLSTVVLADGTKWAFTYDGFGELTSVGLPTGGSITYTWTTIGQANGCSGMTTVSRGVATRTLNDGLGHSSTWTYTWGPPVNGVIANKVTDPLGNVTAHVFTALDGPGGCNFFETSTQYYQGTQNPAHLIKQVDTTYYPGLSNVVPKDITTTLYPSLKTSKIHREYDSGLGAGVLYGNLKKEFDYDWGQGTPGALLRETDTTYEWEVNSAYLTAHLLDLPASVIVYDGGHNKMAETDYLYDEPAYLTATTITTQHGAPPSSVRGNLTTVKHWVNTSNTFIASHTNWFDTGEPHLQIDPLGHTTTLSYDAFYKGAYVTQTCSPSTAGNTVAHCVSGTYNFNTGVLTSLTNENATSQASGNTPGDSAHTGNYTYDYMFRLTSAQAPPDPASNNTRAQTSLSFSAPNVLPLTVTRSKSITTALTDSATATFDGLTRNYRTQHVTPDGNTTVDTVFDAAGRISNVSNPYFSTADSTYGLTQNQYDAMDRATQVTKQDGSINSVAYDVITGVHDLVPGNNAPGDCTDATDEAGKLRRACSDALGRLVLVIEPNQAAAVTTATGSVTINGNEQTTPTATPGTTTTGIGGGDQATTVDFCLDQEPPSSCPQDIWDSGSVTLTINGRSYGVSYYQGSTSEGLTSEMAALINGDAGGFVTATASGGTMTLTSRASGSATNYAFSSSTSSNNPSFFGAGSFFGPSGTLAGGHNAGIPDSGTITATVNGTNYQVSFGSGDTGTTIAARLATAMSSSTAVNAVASGNQVNLTSKTAGAAGNATLSAAYTWNSSILPQPSFTTATSGVAGGYDAGVIDNNPFKTFYTYDALGNLLCVEQHGSAPTGTGCSASPASDATSPWRVRRFTYNSLSRLLTASNPESGTISYVYDDDGNLLMKASPAPNQLGTATQTISYCYDELHRVTGKAYSAAACPLATPVVSYVYDQNTNGIGHLSSLTDLAGTASYSYDILGRLATETRTIAGVGKTISYDYHLDGSLKALHYPSGAVVTYTPDSAGRTISAVDTANAINYVTGATYGPDNALTGFISGNTPSFTGITNSFSYNKRLQPVSISAVSPTQTVFSIGYDFHFGNGNNGNVYGITNGKDSTRNQTFTYDVLNRLTSAQNAGTDCNQTVLGGDKKFWGNTYSYDAWGNLLQKTPIPTACAGEGLSVTVGVNNRIFTAGYGYDAAGNMTSDGLGHAFTYDQENRITGAAGYTYTYDGDGNRVEKANGSVGTLYWYMTPGIVAESDLVGTLKSEYVFFGGERVARRDLAAPTGVFYYFSDHLKTASVVTDATGNIKAESDYYPWGGELQFINADSNHYKFTGKERDAESGLDNFGARMYGNALGRFITPDPLLNSGRPWDPQTWNRYAYAHNNPLTYVDPSGLYDWQANAGGSATDDQLREKSQNKDLSRKDRNAAKNALKFRDKFRAALATATAAAAGTGDSGALAAYGSEGDHNGVNVGTQLGYGAGTVLNKDDTISVNFGKELSGNDLAVTVGHEGQHVEDGQAWVAAGHPALGSPLDMNHYERETRAWGVSARLAQALGMSHFGPHGGGSDYYVWNSSWHNVDRVNAAITKIVGGLYTNATGSPLTPGDTGDRYSRENLPPVGLEFFDRH